MSISERRQDVIILGGGPAGLSAALWCSELGLTSVILEKQARLGGQLHWIHVPIKNYPGIELANGAEYLERLTTHLHSRKFEARTSIGIDQVDVNQKRVVLRSGEVFAGRAMIIATGVRRRKLGVEGEDKFLGRGILQTGQTGREELRNKNLLIVGGGDAAFENASALSAYAHKTYLLHRRASFSARPAFVERVIKDPGIEIITNSAVTSISGGDLIERVEYINNDTGRLGALSIDAILIRIGVVPNTELFRDELDVDEKGYLRIDHTGKTSVADVFAIGDVANPISPTISTAIGTAATAVKTILSKTNWGR
jgi:thioredoxin reductase (NADPH)